MGRSRVIFSIALALGVLSPGNSALGSLMHYPSTPHFFAIEHITMAGKDYADIHKTRIKRVKRILYAMGEPYTFDFLPFNRLYPLVVSTERTICAVGFYKTEDRLAVGKFTKPFGYPEKAAVIVHRDKAAEIRKITSVNDLLSSPLKMAKHPSAHYGKSIDSLLDQYHPSEARVKGRFEGLLKIAFKDQADYMIMEQEDFENFKASNMRLDPLESVAFKDLPSLAPRTFMCSLATPDTTIDALNASIDRVLGQEGVQ